MIPKKWPWMTLYYFDPEWPPRGPLRVIKKRGSFRVKRPFRVNIIKYRFSEIISGKSGTKRVIGGVNLRISECANTLFYAGMADLIVQTVPGTAVPQEHPSNLPHFDFLTATSWKLKLNAGHNSRFADSNVMDAFTLHVNQKIKLYPATNPKPLESQKLIHFVRYMICRVFFKST